jgi:cytochrome P450
MEPIHYKGFTMDSGEYLCVSPAFSQLDSQIWGADANEFNPYRFLDGRPETTEAVGHGALSSYLPFGAGRHRCIGEAFAYVQLKTIMATFVQMFDWEFPPGKSFPVVDVTTMIAMPVKPVLVNYTRRTKQDFFNHPTSTEAAELKEE